MRAATAAARVKVVLALLLFATLLVAPARPALAAPGLEALAGVVGGVPSGPFASANIPGVCSTYGSPVPILDFFGSALTVSIPAGGIAACGYSGDVSDLTAVSGPLSASQTLAPVILGNPGFAGFFNGSADATADYGTLGAQAHGTLTSPGAGSPLALAASSAAAFFDDSLMATSPLVTTPSPGFVRYTFEFDGTLTVPTVAVPFNPGSAVAVLNLEHDNGGPFFIAAASVDEGQVGVFRTLDGSTGAFVTGLGTVGGTGTFTSSFVNGFGQTIDLPITWGQPFELKAGLLASVGGNGDSAFATTARLVKLEFFDANHNPVTTFTVTSASGATYGAPCTFAIAPSSQNFGAAGSGNSIGVTAPPGCAWTAVSNDGFIMVTSGASGSGNGTVGYSVTANTGPARSGTVTVAGKTFTVNQDSGCTFSIAPTSKNFPAGGGTDSVGVTTAAGCVWTATSNDTSVATINGMAGGTGGGSASYTVSANTGGARRTTLTVAGQTFAITQDASTTQPTATTVVSATNPSVREQAVKFTATVSAAVPGAGVPRGEVAFQDGATTLGMATLNSSGHATLTTAALAPGTHPITAHYRGNANFSPSDSAPLSQVVLKTATATSLTAIPGRAVNGQRVNFIATVHGLSPGKGTPTGSITFLDGATVLGAVPLDVGGRATLPRALAAGTYTMTARYDGDANFSGSTSGPVVETIDKAETMIKPTASPNFASHETPVTLTANVLVLPPGVGTPTGTVTFVNGTTVLGTATLSAPPAGGVAQATLTTSALAVGSNRVSVRYGGDASFRASSATVMESITPVPTIVAIVSSLNPIAHGQAVTLAATVIPRSPAIETPTGSVTFHDGAIPLGTVALDGTGKAVLTTSALSTGSHTLTARYAGDALFFQSASPPVAETVTKASTTTALSASPNPALLGQTVTFTVTVSPVAPGAGRPRGVVTFADGATLLGTASLDAAGRAALRTTKLPEGSNVITAHYAGNADFLASTSPPVIEVINPRTP